jgi:hypothetical protein
VNHGRGSSGGVVVMSYSGEQSYIYSKEGVINYLSLYLERVVDCYGAFVGRDGGGRCAHRGGPSTS